MTTMLPSTVRDLTLDLTSVAHTVTAAATLRDSLPEGKGGRTTRAECATIVAAWETLTGLSGDAALEAAQAIARHPEPVHAVVLPF